MNVSDLVFASETKLISCKALIIKLINANVVQAQFNNLENDLYFAYLQLKALLYSGLLIGNSK